MTPTNFKEQNIVLRAPPTMPDCRPLPVYRNPSVVISCWQPNEQEIAALAAGCCVWLTVFGGGQPPVLLSTESPFLPTNAKEGG